MYKQFIMCSSQQKCCPVFVGCLKLLDTLPETVYRVCELLTVVTQRNGLQWQTMVLTNLVKEVNSLCCSSSFVLWYLCDPHQKEGGHIDFGADPVGIGVQLSCLHSIL